MKKLLLGLMSISLMGASLAGCTSPPSASPATVGNVSFAADYDSVYQALAKLQASNIPYESFGVFVPTAGAPAPTLEATYSSTSDISSDHSTTNVQVEGVDEGDIVKTDGTYIYSLQNGKLLIFKADGAATHLVSATEVITYDYGGTVIMPMPQTVAPETGDVISGVVYEYNHESAIEMYLCENYVVIITQFDSYSYGEHYWDSQNSQMCKAYVYDISEAIAPKLVHELGQDGHSLSSRLIGNTLYLLSTYYVYSFSEDEPESFIPMLYTDSEKALISPGCIVIMPYVNSTSYTIVSAIDIHTGTITANQTLLGGGSLVYMSAQNLYIAGYEYKTEGSNERDYADYSVVDYSHYAITHITRLDISRGGVQIAASGTVPGYLDSQFSMDEYQGYFRVVTTDNSSEYSIRTDRTNGSIMYNAGNNRPSTNGLYILDMSLTCVGEVDNLAPGEVVYSVRFDGDIGYFVTFRKVDPLFAVDLSNPAKPAVLSALKIPGFSQYLHVYADGLLFGLGYDANEITGLRGTMKLSMFNTANPADVTEAHTLPINVLYSTASYNHKAILIDATKNIIAFPADSEYLVYGYEVQTGFYPRASINSNDMWWNDSRGLYISGFFYVVSERSIAVIDMEEFTLLATINYGTIWGSPE
ncbi:MAG: beta-propeller domain-containing protein [Dehalococcoidia bacterium]|nr:beta-propeller domain-containing protein [Dehalococcoidia bacterium]